MVEWVGLHANSYLLYDKTHSMDPMFMQKERKKYNDDPVDPLDQFSFSNLHKHFIIYYKTILSLS